MDEETRLVPTDDSTVEAEFVPAPLAPGELAAKVLAVLDLIAEHIPGLQSPHPATAAKVRGARTVPREGVTAVISAVEALPELQAIGTLDPDDAKDTLQSHDDLGIVGDRLAMLLKAVRYTREAQWASLVGSATQTLSIAAIMAKEPENAHIAAHVANIRRHVGRKNGATGKKKAVKKSDTD
jgi:hypothetical protein